MGVESKEAEHQVRSCVRVCVVGESTAVDRHYEARKTSVVCSPEVVGTSWYSRHISIRYPVTLAHVQPRLFEYQSLNMARQKLCAVSHTLCKQSFSCKEVASCRKKLTGG
jgi:hypothetical protein